MVKVIICGNLGKDPEVKYTPGGQAVAKFSVASTRKWTDKASGDKKEETYWGECEAWGKTAELVGEYLAKGSKVLVEGRLKEDRWDDKETGQKRSRTKIVVENVEFLGSRDSSAKASDAPADAPVPPAGGEGGQDIPFAPYTAP